jgi:1-acyl-sn-glycerol-3-phosphate acyltransferase
VNLNRWSNGKAIIEMLAPIDTADLHEADIIALMEKCEQQMHDAQQRLDQELAR